MRSTLKRGVSALATVLTALSVFAILTASVGQLAVERLRGTSRSNIQIRAKYATNYGLEQVCQYLDSHLVYNNASNSLSITPIDFTDFQTKHTQVALSHDAETRFTARLYSNLDGTANIVSPDGVAIVPGQIYIQMLGQVGEHVAKANSRHSGTMAHIGIQEFPYAVLADGAITVNNGTINSYASRLSNIPGPLEASYAAASSPPGRFDGLARIATNGRVNSVVLDQAHVNGTIHYGSGGTPTSALNLTSSTPNTGTALAQPIFLTKYKPPVAPSAATAVSSVTGAGNSLVINAGTYYSSVNVSNGAELVLRATSPGTNNFYFSESLFLNNANLRLDLSAPKDGCRIKVYIGDRLVANNSTINDIERDTTAPFHANQGWSYSLQIFGVGRGGPLGHSEIRLENNSRCFGLIAGVKSQVYVTSGSHLYGAVKAGTLDLINAYLHYDAAVNLASVRSTLWGLVSWTLQGVSDYQGDSLFADLSGDAVAAAAVGPAALGPATATAAGAASDAVTAAAAPAAGDAASPIGDAAAVATATTSADAAATATAATTTAADAAAATAADAAATTTADAAATTATTATTSADAATGTSAISDAIGPVTSPTSPTSTSADAASTSADAASTTADAASTSADAASTTSADAASTTSTTSSTVGDAIGDAIGCPGPMSHCP